MNLKFFTKRVTYNNFLFCSSKNCFCANRIWKFFSCSTSSLELFSKWFVHRICFIYLDKSMFVGRLLSTSKSKSRLQSKTLKAKSIGAKTWPHSDRINAQLSYNVDKLNVHMALKKSWSSFFISSILRKARIRVIAVGRFSKALTLLRVSVNGTSCLVNNLKAVHKSSAAVVNGVEALDLNPCQRIFSKMISKSTSSLASMSISWELLAWKSRNLSIMRLKMTLKFFLSFSETRVYRYIRSSGTHLAVQTNSDHLLLLIQIR